MIEFACVMILFAGLLLVFTDKLKISGVLFTLSLVCLNAGIYFPAFNSAISSIAGLVIRILLVIVFIYFLFTNRSFNNKGKLRNPSNRSNNHPNNKPSNEKE